MKKPYLEIVRFEEADLITASGLTAVQVTSGAYWTSANDTYQCNNYPNCGTVWFVGVPPAWGPDGKAFYKMEYDSEHDIYRLTDIADSLIGDETYYYAWFGNRDGLWYTYNQYWDAANDYDSYDN